MTKTVKKPIYKRLLSAPAETKSDTKSMMPRSHSHPGALKNLGKPNETSDIKRGFKKLFSGPRIKKGYGKFHSILNCCTVICFHTCILGFYQSCDQN